MSQNIVYAIQSILLILSLIGSIIVLIKFYQEIKNTVSEIKAEYSSIYDSAKRVVKKLQNCPNKKEQAIYLLSKPELSPIKNVVFEMLEGKDGQKSIWSNIRKKIKEVDIEE